MKVNKIDHICIAVKDLDAARKIWEPILGKGPDDPYVDEHEKIRVARVLVGRSGIRTDGVHHPEWGCGQILLKRGARASWSSR